jgi:hypothetical protein
MSASQKFTEVLFSLSLILFIIAITSINISNPTYSANKLSYFEISAATFLLFIALIRKFRNIQTKM